MRKTRPWILRAWLEWVVAKELESGDPEDLEAIVEMPQWFIPFELGLGGEGPSILHTARHLDAINRAHRELLAGGKQAKQQTRSSAEKRRRMWQEMLRRLAVDRARERVERRRSRAARLAA